MGDIKKQDGYNMYRGFAVGEEIIPTKGWQAEAYRRGQRFFEPIPACPNLARGPMGAKIAVEHNAQLRYIYETGELDYGSTVTPEETLIVVGGRLVMEQVVVLEEARQSEQPQVAVYA